MKVLAGCLDSSGIRAVLSWGGVFFFFFFFFFFSSVRCSEPSFLVVYLCGGCSKVGFLSTVHGCSGCVALTLVRVLLSGLAPSCKADGDPELFCEC
jgi:hypothetical protein